LGSGKIQETSILTFKKAHVFGKMPQKGLSTLLLKDQVQKLLKTIIFIHLDTHFIQKFDRVRERYYCSKKFELSKFLILSFYFCRVPKDATKILICSDICIKSIARDEGYFLVIAVNFDILL